MSGPERPTEQSVAPADVECAKCAHLNPHGRTVCESCGAHLHVVCHNCGHRNVRARSHCSECGHNLHRSKATRLWRKLAGKDKKLSVLQIVLLVVAIALGAGLIWFFVEYFPGLIRSSL